VRFSFIFFCALSCFNRNRFSFSSWSDCADVAELDSAFVSWFPQLSRGLLRDALKSLEAQSLIFEADTDCFRVVSE
jgi:hypothetical protein